MNKKNSDTNRKTTPFIWIEVGAQKSNFVKRFRARRAKFLRKRILVQPKIVGSRQKIRVGLDPTDNLKTKTFHKQNNNETYLPRKALFRS